MVRLLLNGIVKDEADRIERMLKSVAPYICGFALVDTGSNDDTVGTIERFFGERGLPGLISREPFHDWSQARNAALQLARDFKLPYDYILLVDADMELVVDNPDALQDLRAPSYEAVQVAGSLVYSNKRLIRHDTSGIYRGVTHEYLDCGTSEPLPAIHFVDHADGANRPGKFKRDIALLLKDLRSDPTNVRSQFYLANSYRDAGEFQKAVSAYDKRVLMGGWDQEVWNSMYERAKCYNALKQPDKFVTGMLEAYHYRPSRAEPMYALAQHYREKGKNALGSIFARTAMEIPLSQDQLFVDVYAHTFGPRQEFSITGFYSENKAVWEAAYRTCAVLTVDPTAPEYVRHTANQNFYHYLQTLKFHCASFEAKQLVLPGTPDGYVAMNPSVAVRRNGHDELWAVIRTVNYTMDEAGHYNINGGGGDIREDNPIHTRSFLARLNDDFSVGRSREITMPADWLPATYKYVMAWEDMRLNFRNGEPWVSATVREQNPQGWCEQFEGHVIPLLAVATLEDWRRMPFRGDRGHEKNWSPIDGTNSYQYRLGTVIKPTGETLYEHKVYPTIRGMSGSSQVVRFDGGWVTIVHEACQIPPNGKRYYRHRFVQLDAEFKPVAVTHPFVFHEKEIEFCAGLAAKDDKFVISYGRRDCEAWIATVTRDDVRKMLKPDAAL